MGQSRGDARARGQRPELGGPRDLCHFSRGGQGACLRSQGRVEMRKGEPASQRPPLARPRQIGAPIPAPDQLERRAWLQGPVPQRLGPVSRWLQWCANRRLGLPVPWKSPTLVTNCPHSSAVRLLELPPSPKSGLITAVISLQFGEHLGVFLGLVLGCVVSHCQLARIAPSFRLPPHNGTRSPSPKARRWLPSAGRFPADSRS